MRSLSSSRRRLSRWPRTSVRKRKSCFADCSQAAYVQSRWGSEELIEGSFAVICLRTGHAPVLDAAPAPAPAETPQAKATQSQAAQAAPATRAATPGEETPAGLAAPAFGGIIAMPIDVNRSHVLESELVGGADGVAKAKGKAKAGKKKGGENPKAVFDVRKAKISSLTGAFPLVDRAATKDLLSSVMLGKATWLKHVVRFAGPMIRCHLSSIQNMHQRGRANGEDCLAAARARGFFEGHGGFDKSESRDGCKMGRNLMAYYA